MMMMMNSCMASMMLTNHKLLLRARVTVGALTGASEEASHRALLRSTYGIDPLSEGGEEGEGGEDRLAALVAEEREDGSVALRHVEAAALVDKVIPVALLLLLYENEQQAVGRGGGSVSPTTPGRLEPLTVSAARAALQKKPRVRDALAMLLGSSTTHHNQQDRQ